ncbi:hypothetical protein [Pseudonocardia ailaonensis]|uniref:hypothetical protein n=1 Tax=Pseudonocardia ailaonensis TaxID=367279 RepID=UPI0031DD2DE7
MPGPWDPAPVVERIAAGMARFAEAGIGAETCLVGLDGSDGDPDVDGGAGIVAVVTAALQRQPWEVVVVGGGIRSTEGLLFERVLNAVHRSAPQAAIAFNDAPDTTFEAAARWLT